MQYMGGKTFIARHVESLVLAHKGGADQYVEPFVGGAGTFSRIAPHFPAAFGADVVPDLVMMWQAAIDGWEPPTVVTEDEYRALRHAEPSALRGFVGFGCSFGGKWFGGYARRTVTGPGTKAVRTPVEQSARAVAKQARALREAPHARVVLSDYRSLTARRGQVIYADPPYAGTTAYGAADPFDSGEFWTHAEKWTDAGAVVLVSEYAAPAGWHKVWERPMPDYLRGHGQQGSGKRLEAVFMREEA